MKNNRHNSFLKIKPIYLFLACSVFGLVTNCNNQSRKNLDKQITELDKKITNTRDFSTADVPQKLKPAQKRYVRTQKSLTDNADIIDICMRQNDSLFANAFNNYAVRVGHDYQLSGYLPPHDITTFQKHLTQLDSMDFIKESARKRILQNHGSLHDLSYFLEMMDFDSINSELENKLAWHFYIDTNNAPDSLEQSVLNFENPELNNALMAESNLLAQAWQQNFAHISVQQDTLIRPDSTANMDTANTESHVVKPNFLIPEFDSIKTRYLHNDSVIGQYKNTMDTMLYDEASFYEYVQSMRRKRDSLVQKRREIGI